MVEEGHEIGNHTYNHFILEKLSNAQIQKELALTRKYILAAANVEPKTMRPPYGILSAKKKEVDLSESLVIPLFFGV